MKILSQILLLLCLLAGPLFAENSNSNEYRSKYGFNFSAYKPNTMGNVGWNGGMRTGRYIGTSNVYVDLSAYYGTPTGNNPSEEYLYYGGLGLGYDFRISKVFIGEIGMLVGYGFGKSRELNILETSYYVAQPSMGAGFSLGNGWRLIFAASYIHMNRAQNFSGGTFGVRIDFKSQTVVKNIKE